MEFLNASGKVVRTLVSGGKDSTTTKVVRDMATNDVVYNLSSNLSTKPGLHRMVSPGTYTVRLTVAGKPLEQSFELKLDPKVATSGVSLADVQEQEAVALEITALLTDIKKMAQNVKEEKEALKSSAKRTADQEKQFDQLQDLEQMLVTAEGTYQQPMLIAQMNYLFGIVRRADQIPGQDVYDRLKTLKAEKAQVKTRLDAVMSKR